jgi:hypothetical protein
LGKEPTMDNRSPIKRISVMVGEQQYEQMVAAGLNISAFLRDLIDDHFSNDVITLRVSKKTSEMYTKIISNTGATDDDIEPLLVEVLKKLLDERLQKIKNLKSSLS